MVTKVILLQLASLTCVLGLPLLGAILEDGSPALLVREKREPGRSMTFSGFMPGSGLSAFASSGDFPYYRPRARWGGAENHEEPSTVEQPPERGSSKPWGHPQTPEAEGGVEGADEPEVTEEEPIRPPKRNKKKFSPKEEDEEEYEKPSRSGGNAAASFNAWFPIVLGMFPGSQGEDGGQGGYSRGSQGSRYPHHTTVIANSVSHGRSGIASSHAVAYGAGYTPNTQEQRSAPNPQEQRYSPNPQEQRYSPNHQEQRSAPHRR